MIAMEPRNQDFTRHTKECQNEAAKQRTIYHVVIINTQGAGLRVNFSMCTALRTILHSIIHARESNRAGLYLYYMYGYYTYTLTRNFQTMST